MLPGAADAGQTGALLCSFPGEAELGEESCPGQCVWVLNRGLTEDSSLGDI